MEHHALEIGGELHLFVMADSNERDEQKENSDGEIFEDDICLRNTDRIEVKWCDDAE